MTTSFYAPPDHVNGDRVTLPEDEARHAAKVLRADVGDEIVVVDGAGGWYRVAVDHVGAGALGGHVLERRVMEGEPPYDLVLAVGMIKNRNRFETLLEKAVELGVSAVAPLITERTEKERIRAKRCESILVAAMKQCGRSRLPALHEPVAFDAFLGAAAASNGAALGVICHEKAPRNQRLFDVLRSERRARTIVVAVGPEGGFSDDELHRASVAGFRTVSLGNRRLRVETAGIAAAAAVMLACGPDAADG